MVLILELWWIEIAWKNLLNINIALYIYINIYSRLPFIDINIPKYSIL